MTGVGRTAVPGAIVSVGRMLSPVASVTVKVTVPHTDAENGDGKVAVKRLGFSTAVRAGETVAMPGADERISYGGVPPKMR